MAESYRRRENLDLSPALEGRTQFFSEADRGVVGTVRCGVLFVMAFWSGPARLAFGELQHVLQEVDAQGRLELVVVDTDGCPDLVELPEFARSCTAREKPPGFATGRSSAPQGSAIIPSALVLTPDGC